MGRRVPGQHEKPSSELCGSEQRLVWGGVCGCWGSVVTPASGSPLSSGAGGPWLIEMQGTGWQAAAAAYRQNPGRKGPKGWRGRLRKNQQKAQPAPPSSLALEF